MSSRTAMAADVALDRPEFADRIADQLDLILETVRELCLRIDGRIKSHYTVEEVAELTGRSSYTIRQWISSGRLAAIRVPGTGPKGRLLIPQEELRRLVSAGRASGVPALLVDGHASVVGKPCGR